MELIIDNVSMGQFSCKGPKHEERQILFVSPVLPRSVHALEVRQIGSAPVALHCVYHTIDGYGLYEFEQTEYDAKDGDTVEIIVRRVNGSGDCSVLFQLWPDTAMPGVHYEDKVQVIDFRSTEMKKKVVVKILKSSHGDVSFIGRLSEGDGGIVGFNYSTTIKIKSSIDPSKTPVASKTPLASRTPTISKSPAPEPHHKLSTAAIAGIAGGVGFVVIVVAVIAVLMLRKKRSPGIPEARLIESIT
jgi:hypothetical protein